MKRMLALARIAAVIAAVAMVGCAMDYGVEGGDGEEGVAEQGASEEEAPADPYAAPGEVAGSATAAKDDKADDPYGHVGGDVPTGTPSGSEEAAGCAGTTDRALCPMATKSGKISHGDPIPWKESDKK